MKIFQDIPDGSANIVISPPLEGKKILIYKYVEYLLKKNEPVLYITTDASPEDIKKDLVKHKIFFGDAEPKGLLVFIDCYSRHVGEAAKNTQSIRRLPGPLALNEISVALAELEKELLKKSPKHTILFNSISTMLMFSNPQAIGRFIQVIIAKIKKAGGTVIFTLEEDMHSSDVLATMEHLMDAVIFVKEEKGKLMMKARGLEGLEDWSEFS
jgi:KaiC/GvpD/RAD55 family RecA-like ATPase